MGRHTIRPFGMAVMMAALAAPVVGQGSSVYTHSACVSGRGHTAVAAPCMDASGIYYNPAALALMPSALSAGFTAIYNEGSFTYDPGRAPSPDQQVVDREAATPIVPHGYASIRFGGGQHLAAGFGVWAPYGLGIEWPREFEGRYISWKTQLRGIYLQPTLAYQVVPGRLAIGGGPQIVLGGLELNQDVDAFYQPISGTPYTFGTFGAPRNTPFAAGRIEGDGTGFGGQVGVFFRATDRLSLGARYMHSVKVDLSGDASFEQINTGANITGPFGPGGAIVTVPLDAAVASQFDPNNPNAVLVAQSVEASITFPAQAVVGLAFAATPQLDLAFDYQWTGWSTFDQITPEFERLPDAPLILNYKDAHTFRFGGSYLASPVMALRAGFLYNTAATPDETVTPILPEATRWLLTAGLGYDFGTIRADLMYNLVNQDDRRGRVRNADQEPGNPNIGVYSSTAHLFGVTLSYGLGRMF
jgi:long-chain fatty acid transport protein